MYGGSDCGGEVNEEKVECGLLPCPGNTEHLHFVIRHLSALVNPSLISINLICGFKFVEGFKIKGKHTLQ